MRVLIAGGSGFLGQALAAQLFLQNHTLLILSRHPEKQANRHAATPAEWVGSLQEIRHHVDAVVNLTGANLFSMPWTKARQQILWKSRVDFTGELVRWMLEQKYPPRVFLSGSAIGFYGNCGEKALTEQDANGSDWAASMVAAWEQASLPAGEHGIRTVQLRTGLVLGKGGLMKPLLPLFKAGLGGSLANGQFWYSWIHLQDWVDAVCHLLEHPAAHGPFNLTAPNPVRYSEFARAFGDTLQRPVWLTPPRWALQLLLGKRAELMLSSTKVLPVRLQEAGFRWHHAAINDAMQDLFKQR